jgi:predicted AAA+ superfamily ATPase
MNGRWYYLNKLIEFRNTAELIKVISGVRRCGKSSLLELYHDYLAAGDAQGMSPSIIRINLEDFQFAHIDSPKKLHEEISSRLSKERKNYILLDEVQLIPGWEKAVNSLRLNRLNDIYITGSNTALLNSSLSTLLSGRYVEIKMLPLSFAEFLDFHHYEDEQKLDHYFDRFLEIGGFPGLAELKGGPQTHREYLEGIFNTILIKDMVTINHIRDVDMLQKIILFLSDTIGYYVSAKKIADYIVSTGRKITVDTVDSYLSILEGAYCFYRARRYNLKGKGLMKTNNKFYIVDLGLRSILKGSKASGYGSALENIVYFELLRRGYSVGVGTWDDLEIDFVAERPGAMGNTRITYFQVSATIAIPEVRERELRPLRAVRDNYEKILLTMDRTGSGEDIGGIVHRNIVDWLWER